MRTVFHYRSKEVIFVIFISIFGFSVGIWRLYETVSFSPIFSYQPNLRLDPLAPLIVLSLFWVLNRYCIRLLKLSPDLVIDDKKIWHFREFLPKQFARDRIASIVVKRGGTEWINTEDIYFRDAEGKRLTKVDFHHLDADIEEFISALGDQASLVTFEGEFRHKDRHTGTFRR